MRYPLRIRDQDHLRRTAYEAPSRERPLVYRIGFALLGCTLSLSAIALFLIMVSKRSKNPSDNIATVFIAVIVSGVLVWFATKLFAETSKRSQ
jgi:hypothetical protein